MSKEHIRKKVDYLNSLIPKDKKFIKINLKKGLSVNIIKHNLQKIEAGITNDYTPKMKKGRLDKSYLCNHIVYQLNCKKILKLINIDLRRKGEEAEAPIAFLLGCESKDIMEDDKTQFTKGDVNVNGIPLSIKVGKGLKTSNLGKTPLITKVCRSIITDLDEDYRNYTWTKFGDLIKKRNEEVSKPLSSNKIQKYSNIFEMNKFPISLSSEICYKDIFCSICYFYFNEALLFALILNNDILIYLRKPLPDKFSKSNYLDFWLESLYQPKDHGRFTSFNMGYQLVDRYGYTETLNLQPFFEKINYHPRRPKEIIDLEKNLPKFRTMKEKSKYYRILNAIHLYDKEEKYFAEQL